MSAKYLELFRKNVSMVLVSKDLSQSDLAKRLQVTPQQISKLMKGTSSPSFEKICEVADALGVPPFVLLMSPLEKAKWDLFCAPSAMPSEIAASYAALNTPEPKKKKR